MTFLGSLVRSAELDDGMAGMSEAVVITGLLGHTLSYRASR